MVISFTVDEAFRHLRNTGFVVTFRPDRRKQVDQLDWANRGRGEPKEFDVFVGNLGNTVPPGGWEMRRLAPWSGLTTLDRWVSVIEELHGELPEQGHLYGVHRIRD